VTRRAARGGRVQGVALFLAGAINGLLGVFAAFDPLGFYRRVPGVSMMGPYDQHFVVDVGFLFLALTVTLVVALLHREKVLVRTACASALTFAVPHLWFHASHLSGFSTAQAVNELGGLVVMVAAPLVALVTTFVSSDDTTSAAATSEPFTAGGGRGT
jgi:hypothetical protein